MKKVLVTGAAGVIGINVIKFLLSEGKYEITAIDLRSKESQNRLKRYRRRINIIYGDINDRVLMEALVKEQDAIIHLAGVLPPIADIKRDLGKLVEYNGTENIVKSLNFYNPDCFLVYASSATIYGDVIDAYVDSDKEVTDLDYYSKMKVKVEKLIKDKLKNYTIIRLPLVLTHPKSGKFMYNVKRLSEVEAITDNDAGYLFAASMDYQKELNKKIFNAGGGDATRGVYKDILIKILEIYGFSWHYFLSLVFIDKNFYVQKFKDSDKLQDIIDFRSDSLSSYYMRVKRTTKKRTVARLVAKPFIWVLRGKKK